ncbi:MAG: hypothetical protein ACPGQL_05195 [Thermoplasmatota archaeon]
MALSSIFASTILFSFGFSLFLAGLFGAYFGTGKSRSIGFVLALVAVLLVALFAALTWPLVPGLEPQFDSQVVGQSMVAVLAATLGSVLAGAAFIASVMKS